MKKYLQKLDTLGLLLLLAAVIRHLVSNVWEKWNVGLAIAGGLILIIGIAANYRRIISSLGRRSTKYALNYVFSILLVIAAVSLLNFLGQRHIKRFDMTGSGQFTLAPQTTQVLAKLKADVSVKAFFPGGDYEPLKELLVEYRTVSRHFRYEFIDPDRQPDVAKQYDVKTYGTFRNPLTGTQIKFGTVILTLGDRQEKIEKRSEEVREEDLTNAIIKVGRSEAKKIYFIEGHGEKDIADTDRSGYSEAQKALESQGYTVGKVNIAAEGKIPADAKVLIEAGPTTEPFPQEMELINGFLKKGSGSLFVLVDPQPSPSLESFLKPWGVQVDNNLVLDVSGAGRLMGAGPQIPLILSYESHPITDRFRAMTFFPFTRSIQPGKTLPAGLTAEPLFKSNESSWGETNLGGREASYDPTKDAKGPLSLAVAATKEITPSSDKGPGTKARLVVVGTSNFPINAYFPQQGNGNLFMNIVSWLAQDEDLISIRPKPSTDRRILLSQSQLSTVRLVSMFLLPGIALVAGIVVVVNRRRR
jgi:ABC-type uncharacterized transport system involved in gliding motility auxiliary subunit